MLLDYYAYTQDRGISYAPNDYHEVSASDLDECAKKQGTVLEQGDILFVRTGFVSAYENAAQEDRDAFGREARAAGLRQGMEEVQWLWCVWFIYRYGSLSNVPWL